MADKARGRSIAVAAILATAIAGIAGTAGWLLARDDGNSQRAPVQEGRRAETYRAALRLIDQQQHEMRKEALRFRRRGSSATYRRGRFGAARPVLWIMNGDRGRVMDRRMDAFGSPEAIARYRELRELADFAENKFLLLILREEWPPGRLRISFSDTSGLLRKSRPDSSVSCSATLGERTIFYGIASAQSGDLSDWLRGARTDFAESKASARLSQRSWVAATATTTTPRPASAQPVPVIASSPAGF